jgi:purine nucleosidase
MCKVVWDMDPGIDDVLALILALKSSEVQILGITTVAGNASVEMTSANARRVLEYLSIESVPVAAGGKSVEPSVRRCPGPPWPGWSGQL